MQITYHDKWFRRRGQPIGTISRAVADTRYSSGEPFCLVARDDNGSFVGFVEVGSGVFGAGFLDGDGNVDLDYSFVEQSGKLFLSQAVVVEVADHSPNVQVTHYFDPSGQVVIETWAIGSASASRTSGQVDVSSNWESVPTFEQIPNLLCRERLILPKHGTEVSER